MTTERMPVPAGWAGPIDDWVTALRAAGRTAQTVETRTDHVRRLARAMGCGPWEVSGQALLDWAGGQEWSRETRRSVYASVKGFYRWAVGAGLTGESPAVVLPSVRPEPPCPRPAPEDAYRAALAVADLRTRVIVRLAAEAGLRRAEIAQVHASDLLPDLAGTSLLVHGKGGRKRIVPLSPLLEREVGLLLDEAGGEWLLPSDRTDTGHLTPRRVGELARRVLPDGWTLHPLRHRYATRSYAVDRDLLAVSSLLGHASVATTQRYVRPPQDSARRAASGAWSQAA